MLTTNKRGIGKTVVSRIDPVRLTLMRELVYQAIPHLKWRHSGLGMLQAYVKEGARQELRVHIWHQSLRLAGINDAGLGHDHRFDMRSWVLVGQLIHKEIRTSVAPDGVWKMYEVVNARKALRDTGSRAGEFRQVEASVKIRKRAMTISAGHSYFFPKRTFHETLPNSKVVITVALKTKQEELPARVLSRSYKQPRNAFEISLPTRQWELVLGEAEAALRGFMGPSGPHLKTALTSIEYNLSSKYLCKNLIPKSVDPGFDLSRLIHLMDGEDSL